MKTLACLLRNFANVIFEEGHYLYSDADGIVVSKNELVKPEKI